MKHLFFIKITCIALFLFLISIGNFSIGDSTCEIESIEYTGPNKARIIYETWDEKELMSLRTGDVFIFNKDYTKRYSIQEESAPYNVGKYRYAVDITVEPEWEPGDLVTVTGRGHYLGDASFNVPQ
jgi:hypothetical protein